jgi:hypothetical protein
VSSGASKALVTLCYLLASVALLSGCGGGKKAAAKPRDPNAVARSFFTAAASGKFGPTLKRRFAPFAGGYSTIVSERITDQFGLIAIKHGRAADAVVMHRHGALWTVDFKSPIVVEPLGPKPGSRTLVVQVAAELRQLRGKGDTAVIYVDGAAFDSRLTRIGSHATLFANLLSPLAPGLHNAAVFATDGLTATARAWTFTAVK